MGESESSLSRLRSKPFELLREIERRSRLALAGGRAHASAADEWVGNFSLRATKCERS
jgi:hypothetical protein